MAKAAAKISPFAPSRLADMPVVRGVKLAACEAGIRYKNTYRGGEVTNHIYGIAIDIDPAINTCCGCVPPWNDAPACKKPAKTEYDRMAMPECWVHAFERYGFYWLGHDTLRDTMKIDKTVVPVLTVKRGRVFEPEWGPHPWGWEPERVG